VGDKTTKEIDLKVNGTDKKLEKNKNLGKEYQAVRHRNRSMHIQPRQKFIAKQKKKIIEKKYLKPQKKINLNLSFIVNFIIENIDHREICLCMSETLSDC